MRPHRGRVLVLSVTSLLGGAIEALFLVVITRAALAIANGKDDFGVLAGRSASLAAGIGVAALLLVVRLILGLAAVRVSAELSVAVLTDARHRLSDAYLNTSWAVQHAEPSGWLQELLGGFAGLASGVATSFNVALIAPAEHRGADRGFAHDQSDRDARGRRGPGRAGSVDRPATTAHPGSSIGGGRRADVHRDDSLGTGRVGHGDAVLRCARPVRGEGA